jgi:hypothetical protein
MRPLAVILFIATVLATSLADAGTRNAFRVRSPEGQMQRAVRATSLRLQRKSASMIRKVKPFAGEAMAGLGGAALVTFGVLGGSDAAIGIGVGHLVQARLLGTLRRKTGLTFNPATEMMQTIGLAGLIHPEAASLALPAGMTLATATAWKAYDAGVYFTKNSPSELSLAPADGNTR